MTIHKIEYLTDLENGQLKVGDTIEVEKGYSPQHMTQPSEYEIVPFNGDKNDA